MRPTLHDPCQPGRLIIRRATALSTPRRLRDGWTVY